MMAAACMASSLARALGFAGRARNAFFACEQADAQNALTHGGSLGPAAAVPLEKN